MRPEESPKPLPAAPLTRAAFAFLRHVKSRKQYLKEQDKAYLEQALAESGGCVSAAARRVGIERTHLHKLMRRYGITAQDPGRTRATRVGIARRATEGARTAQQLLARLARPVS